MLFWYFLFCIGRLPLLTFVLYCLRIGLSLSVYFQGLDYGGMTPVRYVRLKHKISGLCVSGRWLVVTDGWSNTTRLYSLPDLTLHHQVTVEWCRQWREGLCSCQEIHHCIGDHRLWYYDSNQEHNSGGTGSVATTCRCRPPARPAVCGTVAAGQTVAC